MLKKSNTFYCFSPPVMLATFFIELGLAAYVILRYKMTPVVRLVVIILITLAVFQIAEYSVCEMTAGTALMWSRIGHISIALLPALALHLIFALVKPKNKQKVLVGLAYAMSLGFAATFAISATAFGSQVCGGNYAILQLSYPLDYLFFAYYYGWLIVGICLCIYYAVRSKLKIRESLAWQMLGYLSFMLPTGIVNTLSPDTIAGIPSIMCGFAVIYAIILAFGIVPATQKLQKSGKSKNS